MHNESEGVYRFGAPACPTSDNDVLIALRTTSNKAVNEIDSEELEEFCYLESFQELKKQSAELYENWKKEFK